MRRRFPCGLCVAVGIKNVSMVDVIRDCIIPSILIGVEIQDSGIPVNITSENQVWWISEFGMGVWTHAKMRQAIPNTEGENTPINGLDMLKTAGELL
jgi:hypothetical protein